MDQIKREICSKGSKRVITKESNGAEKRNRKIEWVRQIKDEAQKKCKGREIKRGKREKL